MKQKTITNSIPKIRQIFFVDELQIKQHHHQQNHQNDVELEVGTDINSNNPVWSNSSSTENVTVMGDDFYFCSRPLFLLGKLCGLIPIKGLISTELEQVDFQWTSFWTVMSIIICIVVSVVAGIGLIEFSINLFGINYRSGSTHRLILLARGPLILAQGSLMYALFITKSPVIVRLFKKWRIASRGLVFSTNHHQNVRTRVTILTFVILIPTIIHLNLVVLSGFGIWHTNSMTDDYSHGFSYVSNNNTSTPPLKLYFARFWPSWTKISPYNSLIVGLIIFLVNLTHCSWLFVDLLVIILSILLYGKFKTVCHVTAQAVAHYCQPQSNRLLMFRKTALECIPRSSFWAKVRRDHLICMNLLWDTEELLSPFIFISYAMSIYFICTQIRQGITPASNHGSYEESALAIISLFLLVSRMMFMSLTAAKINEYARGINLSIQKCPNFLYSSELERLERMLSTNHAIGLSGLGCFVVTRAFLLVLGSVVFTFEIVLLQTPNPDSDNNFSFCNLTNAS